MKKEIFFPEAFVGKEYPEFHYIYCPLIEIEKWELKYLKYCIVNDFGIWNYNPIQKKQDYSKCIDCNYFRRLSQTGIVCDFEWKFKPDIYKVRDKNKKPKRCKSNIREHKASKFRRLCTKNDAYFKRSYETILDFKTGTVIPYFSANSFNEFVSNKSSFIKS